ncbi:DHA2 family efflux MFS transporter permease subunit [Actinomadura barringtoniae]|uniref:DHA2 family efflux MFS transporter permease subunit n=1 Tax=Actinomadura barringtoniae TaxID=1427535 RepID=A0A939PB23_9ACTN|nr:DHA2 family efflux MFS transporter permease subunit [Actinomadura barringtoniae]MBO2449300.1 DHA2 family efflux MFS transporter permease subunit [Actinomadura barringtoniae]
MTTELSSPVARSPAVESPVLPLRRAWLVLAVVVVADIMDVLDSTVANLAGPSIRADLGGADSTVQWVPAAYTAAFALGLVTSGRLGDLVGRRRLFLAGLAGFTLASLACGLAPGVWFLIGARVLQGLCGSVMIPQGFALVKIVFLPQHLRRALIPFGPIMGLATVAGPILAGWLLHLNLFGSEWRSIFLINVPIGVAALLLGALFLPRNAGEDTTARLDLRGVGLLTLASALLIIPLVQGRELGWPLWTYAMMAASVPVLALFAWSERRSAHPVIAPTLFRKRSFIVGLVIVGGFYAGLTGFQLALNLMLQLGAHWTPLHTGLTLIPWALGSAVAVGLAGAFLAERLGRATLHLGLGIAAAGLVVLGVTVAYTQDSLTSWTLAPALLITGFGSGLVFIPIFDYVLGDATSDEVGTGSGMLNAAQQFANATGAAALGTAFFAQAAHGGFFDAGELITGLAAALFLVTLLLVGLLPKHAQQGH